MCNHLLNRCRGRGGMRGTAWSTTMARLYLHRSIGHKIPVYGPCRPMSRRVGILHAFSPNPVCLLQFTVRRQSVPLPYLQKPLQQCSLTHTHTSALASASRARRMAIVACKSVRQRKRPRSMATVRPQQTVSCRQIFRILSRRRRRRRRSLSCFFFFSSVNAGSLERTRTGGSSTRTRVKFVELAGRHWTVADVAVRRSGFSVTFFRSRAESVGKAAVGTVVAATGCNREGCGGQGNCIKNSNYLFAQLHRKLCGEKAGRQGSRRRRRREGIASRLGGSR